jgi:hypothetical protein
MVAAGDLLQFLVGQLADDASGRADDQRAFGDDLAFGNQRVGADQAVLADHRAVEQGSAHADQAAVADDATVQDDPVTDGDIAADDQLQAGVGVQHRAVLDVGVFPDVEQVGVAAQRAVPPDGDVTLDSDLTDDRRVRGDPALRMNVWRMGAEGIDGHGRS